MRVTVIIPTLNEARSLPATLASLAALERPQVIVADGGSEDGTLDGARLSHCAVVKSPRGRARQMNAGARLATGDVILFLHADCRLPANAEAALRQALEDPRVGWGAFRHRINARHPLLRVIERADNLRARWLRRPYGDQAIFVRRELFKQAGGFPDVPLLEEVLLARRLARLSRFQLAEATISTDARRWEQHGVLRVTALNWGILLAARLGVPIAWLARVYYGRKST